LPGRDQNDINRAAEAQEYDRRTITVAHSLSAKKRIRQNAKRRARNRWRKTEVKDTVKAFEEACKDGKPEAIQDALRACYKELDQVAAKGTIHKNTASRKKSRLAAQANKAINA
jgi:small subunit ribosomal protein S20